MKTTLPKGYKIESKCPFCGRKFTAGETFEGRHGVTHEMPMCERFEKLGPVEFLHAVNERIRG